MHMWKSIFIRLETVQSVVSQFLSECREFIGVVKINYEYFTRTEYTIDVTSVGAA